MKLSSYFSVGASLLALVLAVWLLISSGSNISLQASLQKQQDEIQTRQQAVQLQQQQLQTQQQQIESGAQLAQQVGPAVLRDLAELQVQNKNTRIRDLLKKHGLEVKETSGSNSNP